MPIQEIRVTNLPHVKDPGGESLLHTIKAFLGIHSIHRIATAKVYRFEGVTAAEAEFLARNLLAEDIFQHYTVNRPIITGAGVLVEVAYKPGVMNPEAGSIMKAAADLQVPGLTAADSSTEYGFFGAVTAGEVQTILSRLLVNETVERVVDKKPATLIIRGETPGTRVIPIRSMDDQELMELSQDNLFLNLAEMRAIKSYFTGLERDPTDCEVETLAQTWSEHCVHKTFKAQLMVDGRPKQPLLKRLQEATAGANHPLVLSAFVDNSGVMALYDNLAVCGKVETHNSPSAIEPYGGAMTGSGGVFRDIMGTGKGARVIASTDMFCFAPPDLPNREVPEGCLHPRYLLQRVVAGVRDYGNRMGVPTNNGSVHFHHDFRAKPTIIVGAYGIMSAADAPKGRPGKGDIAVAVGGRTGRDGIHGATFSSGEMTHRTMDVNASAVQIGNAIEEKRMSDALLKARDQKLIRAITDCGAGGFASAFGEMGESTGVKIHLDRAPLKYPGLAPWEIWLSESQERMALAVAPENLERLLAICREHNVEATAIGEFTGTGRLEVYYGPECACRLDMEFLHHGLPPRTMTAAKKPLPMAEKQPAPPADWNKTCAAVMAHLNVCSKEPIVRVYDHGVQGSNALPPFGGLSGGAPNDAVVLAPVPGKKYGLVISHGLNPALNLVDPYAGSLWAATEAVANAVAVGADPADLVLIDNFIWPYPDQESLYDLDRAVDACTDFVQATGMPFISGKDSLSSTYRAQDGSVIKIPPVLCVSCFGRVKDVTATISADLKGAGSTLVLVGERDIRQMGGSAYFEITGGCSPLAPQIDPAKLTGVLEAVHAACKKGAAAACHDISEGGLLTALAEMCFGGDIGAIITLPTDCRADYFLFNETAGCFLVEVDNPETARELFAGIPHLVLGGTVERESITIHRGGDKLFEVPVTELFEAWRRPMREVFGA
ncbi:MAG: phosphoribosylformylglycinamidine synthase subunit PurL [Firmicutes bacterium]|nr:phosphoribosylformylglycinamidine synthase subunit PurL [Bacillota bacterium]